MKCICCAFFIFSFLFTQEYSIGDQVSIDDQNTAFGICYGDYPFNNLALANYNGELNGGNYGITILIKQTAY